jgi:type VI secretion system protein ImpH
MRGATDPLERTDPLRRIAAEPWRYDFFHAMRWIESRHPDKPRFGTARRPADEPVRLGQSADLSFAPSPLQSVTPATATSKPRIEVRFFGLFGPNGPLPYHLTEYARQRLMHHGDATFARFADMFHHRLLLLFYRAWAQAQPTVGLDRPADDRFSAYVGSLVGIGAPELRGRDAAPGHIKLHFSGILSNQVRNADGLASLLSGFLRRPVTVEQFVGCWLELPRGERTRIGGIYARRKNPSTALGGGAVLGQMVWDRQHKFRIHIGPLDHAVFESLLPQGKALPAVSALVEQYIGVELAWDLRLGLKPEQVRPCRLGQHGRLGWTSWVGMQDRRHTAELTLMPRLAKPGVSLEQ